MLARRTPLRRKTWMRQGAPKHRHDDDRGDSTGRRSGYRERPRETERMLWIKTLPCCAPGPHECHRIIEAHHAGPKPGMGRKAPDDTCIPLCRQAHSQIDAFSGPFRDFDRARMRSWQDEQVANYQALWEQQQAARLSENAERADCESNTANSKDHHAPGPGGEVAPAESNGLPATTSTPPQLPPPPFCQQRPGGGW